MNSGNKMPDQNIELRSEEAQEVLGQTPVWVLRWGITVLFIVVIALLCVSFFFRYPDTITAEMILTSDNPSVEAKARFTGRIMKLYVEDRQFVETGKYLAVIENSAKTEDILHLKKLLDSVSGCPEKAVKLFSSVNNMVLGDVQAFYTGFQEHVYNLNNYLVLNYYPQKIDAIKKQIAKYDTYYHNLLRQRQIETEQFAISHGQYRRDSVLYGEGIIALADLEISKTKLLQQRNSLEQLNASIDNLKIQLGDLETGILDLQLERADKQRGVYQNYATAFEQLRNGINNWELNYVLRASVPGYVSFTKVWQENQHVSSGDLVFAIVPEQKTELIGKAMLPPERSGKVKTGQRVIIRFLNYPDQEFGIVNGRVAAISAVPNADRYVVEIVLPNGLYTNYRKELPFHPQMKAQADIVTEDIRLIERIFYPVKQIFKEGFERNSDMQ